MSVYTMSGITDDGSHSMDTAMKRLYDPAFKLFGRTIPVSSDSKDAVSGEQEPRHTSIDTSIVQDLDETPDSEDEGSVPDEFGSSSGSNDGCEEDIKVELVGGDLGGSVPHAANHSEAGRSVVAPSTEDEGKEALNLDQAPKKPDKPVHCPRCKSLDTKFCYFNNYNVNQPRHFCKNCQRYWTAGGTLRNVPVGAGRRKNKHSGAHPRSMLPDVVMVRSDPPGNAQHLLSAAPASSPSGLNRHIKSGLPSRNLLPLEVQSLASLESPSSSAVLSFGQESPVCISTGVAPFAAPCKMEVLQGYKPEMSQAQANRNKNLNESLLAPGAHMDHKACEVKQNASNKANEFGANVFKPVARQPVEEKPAEFSQPEVITPKSEAGGASDIPKYMDAALAWASSAPFSFMGGPWQYGANLGWGNAIPPAALASMAQGVSANPLPTSANQGQGPTEAVGTNPAHAATFGSQPPWAAAAMGPWAGGIPWPLMQSPLWGPPGWGGAPWSMPWAAPFTAAAAAAAAAATAAAAAAAANTNLGSTILGKHAREQGEAEIEKVLVPKTLRIDDPGEAARSSIWSTLGIGLRSDTLAAGGIFGDFKAKAEMSRKSDDPNARTRISNPAGLDRSLSFQENNAVSASGEGKEK